MYNNRKYVILTASEAEDIEYDEVGISSVNTLTWNTDNTKTFVKYDGSQPSFLSGKTELSHSAMLAELAKSEWTGEPNPPEG